MRELVLMLYTYLYVYLFFAQNRNSGCSFWHPAGSRAYFQFQILLLFKMSRILAFIKDKSRIPENLSITLETRSWNSRSLIAHTSTGLIVAWLTCVICHTFDSALCIILYPTCIKSVTSQGKIYQNKVGELKSHVKDVLRRKIHCSNTFLCPENSSLRMAKWISDLWKLPIEMVTFNTPTLKPLMTRGSFGMARSKSMNLLLNLATNL